MRYYRNETVQPHEPFEHPESMRNRISVGNRGYDAIYLAVDEDTGEVHNEVMTESLPRSARYMDLNDTAKDPKYKENDQLPLFHTEETPGKFRVGLVTGTERGRTHSMVLMAIAKARGEHFVGPTEIDPGDDLSPHSYALAKNLEKRGLLSADAELPNKPTNTYDFNEPEFLETYSEHLLQNHGDERISASEIRSGKAELKRMLRGAQTPKPKPPINQTQFYQPSFFDE